MTLTDEIKILDDKIKEAAKIPAILSGEVEKYNI